MKRFWIILLLASLLTPSLWGQMGSSCDHAFPLESAGVITISAGEYWYEAESFVLPYNVFLPPDNPSDKAPQVYADMSCPHGYSPDPLVQKHLDNAWKTLFPRRLHLDTLRTEDGRPTYKCYYGRDRLKILEAYGIKYSIPVYIHIIVYGSGKGQAGDHEKGLDCQYTAKTLRRDSTVDIAPQDTIFRLKLSDLEDVETVRFRWQADDDACPRAYFTGVCDSILDDAILLDSMDFAMDEDSVNVLLDIKHSTIASWIKKDADGDVFIRLHPTSAGTLSWSEYQFVPTCNNQSIRVLERDTILYESGSILETYKINANRWQSSAHLLEWEGTDMVRVFMADTCHFSLVRTNRHVAFYRELMPGDSVVISSSSMQKICSNYSDSYDNVYIKLRSNGSGQLVTRVVPDPLPPTPTAVIEMQTLSAPRRLVMDNGQIVIVFNGHRYNLLGYPID